MFVYLIKHLFSSKCKAPLINMCILQCKNDFDVKGVACSDTFTEH